MDYLKIIDNIIDKLANNKELYASQIIMDIKNNSFTSTELLISIVFELNKLIKNNSHINKIIGSEVQDLIIYCKKIGIEIKR